MERKAKRNKEKHIDLATKVTVGEAHDSAPLSEWISASENLRQGRNDSDKRRRLEMESLRKIPFKALVSVLLNQFMYQG